MLDHLSIVNYLTSCIIASLHLKDKKNSDCYLPEESLKKKRVRVTEIFLLCKVPDHEHWIRTNKSSMQIKKCLVYLAGG